MVFEDTGSWMPMDDGTQIYIRRWPAAEGGRAGSGGSSGTRAILHIVHGMAEHSLRYARLARRLGEEGIEVWAADQRGHGQSACDKNDAGKGGLLGHCADGNGFARVTADIDIINRAIAKERPGLPVFLMGHSWGSFIAQNYIESFFQPVPPEVPVQLAGCILSGTRGPGGMKTSLGLPVMRFLAFVKGSRNGSALARTMADGPYNKPFRPNRTNFDWLSRDVEEVDAYIKDPLCGFLCSSGFYRDMIAGLIRIHRSENLGKISRELPVYVFSGSADPVGEMGESPTALVTLYRSLRLKDLQFVLYPDARHEALNETNRDEVAGNLLSWLIDHCKIPCKPN